MSRPILSRGVWLWNCPLNNVFSLTSGSGMVTKHRPCFFIGKANEGQHIFVPTRGAVGDPKDPQPPKGMNFEYWTPVKFLGTNIVVPPDDPNLKDKRKPIEISFDPATLALIAKNQYTTKLKSCYMYMGPFAEAIPEKDFVKLTPVEGWMMPDSVVLDDIRKKVQNPSKVPANDWRGNLVNGIHFLD